jgi:hypothetical protein
MVPPTVQPFPLMRPAKAEPMPLAMDMMIAVRAIRRSTDQGMNQK